MYISILISLKEQMKTFIVELFIIFILLAGCNIQKTGQAYLTDVSSPEDETDEISLAVATMSLDVLKENLIDEGFSDAEADEVVELVREFQEDYLKEKGLESNNPITGNVVKIGYLTFNLTGFIVGIALIFGLVIYLASQKYRKKIGRKSG